MDAPPWWNPGSPALPACHPDPRRDGSDIACYPSRLLNLVKRWLEADKATNFCCTIKLQGETDHEAVRAFAAIPGSHIRHLSCNKHELTWYLVRS